MICPICKKEYQDDKYKPFCSKRCADIDLANWFNGKYAFEANRLDENDMKDLEEMLKNEDVEKEKSL